ncbi:hypothetical protein FACS1894104_0620 [Actinomycetota bacterium]|nr:hypothetical protein FACS1894104_0620 [Actinomycetota bacterium]
MTATQKNQIKSMRMGGKSYAVIADALSISENTVKSYCRRNGLGGIAAAESDAQTYCHQCGTSLVQTGGAKAKRFCSDKCRTAWWNTHPEKLGSAREFVCQTCGKAFKSYGKRERKYCSRSCYGRSKVAQP